MSMISFMRMVGKLVHQIITMENIRKMHSLDRDGLVTRILHVPGYDERYDDLLFVSKQKNCEENNVIVYFGGDVQDFTENMIGYSENTKYVKWSLENIAVLLHRKFEQSHVLVIKPSRYYNGTFSCYDNFVPSGDFGVPEFIDYHNALVHLKMILNSVSVLVAKQNELEESKTECSSESPVCFEKSRVKLIGFSKGCVVLNQLIYEFHFLHTRQPENELLQFLSRISDMYFLDGGHSGKKNTWITERCLLYTFSKLNINIHVHVTPYQVKDKIRPWIGKEEKKFTELLKEFKANITRQLHFDNQPASLSQHFEILDAFA